ncbi:DUF2716 domain-containing protein [Butyrivibrio sp. NC2002]|uniref:DUF2716 domain-containing protein n=1 Tax=Butyrivibrio sp. NC2002 TaxID=1410610 RepID=UPI000691B000
MEWKNFIARYIGNGSSNTRKSGSQCYIEKYKSTVYVFVLNHNIGKKEGKGCIRPGDPRNPDEQRSVQNKDNSTRGYSIAYFLSFIPDGDYHFFIEENFAFGYLGHPWRQEIWVFGNRLVEKTEEAYQKFGWTKIK